MSALINKMPSMRAAGVLLVASLPLLFLGAALWRMDFQNPDLAEALRAIARHDALWRWIQLWLAIGLVVGILGLGGLVELLRDAGDRFFGAAGLLLYVIGSVPWLVVLACRVTVVTAVAARSDLAGVVESYAPWHRAAGVVVASHLALAYVATICFGVAILRTRLLGSRVGWTGIIVGGVTTLGLAVFPFGFLAPFMVLVYPFIVGVALLRARTRADTSRGLEQPSERATKLLDGDFGQ